jgi:hypothetical protein
MKIPNREDEQYLAVEKFEDYELTYCMAYEMAIRNDEVIQTIYSFYNNYVNNDIYDCFILSTDDFKKCDKDSQKLMKFDLNPLSLYLNYHFFKNINDHIEELKEDDSKANNDYFSHRLSWILFTPYQGFCKNKIIPKKKIIEYKTTKFYTSFINHKINEDNKTMSIYHNDITPNYSRPLSLSFNDIKERRLILNMALPINELIDFITKLKKDYEHDHSFFKTVKELEGDSFKKANKRDGRLSSQTKLADMFYIYDCLKLGRKKSDIKTDITIYYRLKGIDTRQLHIDTLNTYHEIMKDYIDNLKYKELVLGIKV